MRTSSHTLDRIHASFDDDHVVANAGLIGLATLAEHLGPRELFDTHVDLRAAPGHANVGLKAMELIHSALSGGDLIDDAGAVRAASTPEVLGHAVRRRPPSGPSLDRSPGAMSPSSTGCSTSSSAERGQSGADPGTGPVILDVDSTICETYGLAKQGARFWHAGVRGYHPLLATLAGTDDVVGVRLSSTKNAGQTLYTVAGEVPKCVWVATKLRGPP